MRAGGCSVQQALTNEAAGVVKQAVALAKRRGHAQVTPLHVANTMLSAPSGLLRAACLQSHSHPLQCKALELCFNVALNRLPASSSSPMLGPAHSQYPSISNALVAAFKRAQAHQRRGSIENQQQQPVLAVKIELEQLIISILDDPSVSRVMREAGFSSTQVKTNIEKSVSLESTPQNSPPCSQNERKVGKVTETEQIRNEDVEIIIDNLQKNKSLVIVGECISNIESGVKGLMNRVDKGEVNEDLREVKFITIPPLNTFCNLQREEVEQKIGELSCLVKSLVSKGVVLYLGDLKWVSEYRVNLEQANNYYCSVEHMIMELGKLVCGINNGRFWLLGIATFQTYMRCRNGYHSLETVWGLHPVTIPANSLGLSLISDHSDEVRNGRVESGSHDMQGTNGELKLTCCAECSVKFEAEARELQRSETKVGTLSNLPPWLKDETTRLGRKDEKPDYSMEELYKKWNSYCNTAHKQFGRTLTFPSSSISCFSLDQSNPNLHQKPHFTTWKENYHLWPYNCSTSSNPNSTPNSTTSSSDNLMETDHYIQKFKEFNAQNLNTLCNALERKVPWQKQIIPEIVGTILQCRSRMTKRKLENVKSDHHIKEETWLFFLGLDTLAKERISRELAKAVFGTYSNFVTIGLGNFNDNDDLRNKRGRDDEESCKGYMERFAEAVSANPHRVFFVEDLEQIDYRSQMSVKRAIESGGICRETGEEVSFCDAIVILSCESFSSGRSRGGSPRQKTEHGNGDGNEEDRVSLDLNISCDNYSVDDQCGDGLGILESVDRRVLFNIHDF